MILGVFLFVVLAVSVARTSVFWELLTGATLIAVPICIAAGEWATALASLLFFFGCCWHWWRTA